MLARRHIPKVQGPSCDLARRGSERGVGSEAWGLECLIRPGLPRPSWCGGPNSAHGTWPTAWRDAMAWRPAAGAPATPAVCHGIRERRRWAGDLSQWRCLARFVFLWGHLVCCLPCVRVFFPVLFSFLSISIHRPSCYKLM